MNYYRDRNYTEKEMRDQMRLIAQGYKPYGGTSSMAPLADILRGELPHGSGYHDGCSYADLRAATPRLDGQLYPAIIRIQLNHGGGHYIVVVETVGGRFMVLDPEIGSTQVLGEAGLNNYQNKGAWDGRMVTSWT